MRAELKALHESLALAVDLAAAHDVFDARTMPEGLTFGGQPPASLEDYVFARDLVASLARDYDSLEGEARERLELNGDLPQLAFHLREEVEAQRRDGVDPESFGRSLTFLRRHIVRLRQEYVDEQHFLLDADERALLTRLAKLVRTRYQARFADRYAALRYRRPFVDKFYRDYSLTGIPDGLLDRLESIAGRPCGSDGYDVVMCVLKGGLPFTTLLELLGFPSTQIVHLRAGRATGSHHETEFAFEPLDFALSELSGRSVLIVDNNLASGSTMRRICRSIADIRPARVGVFLDYILSDLAGITAHNLSEHMGFDFHEVICGPFVESSLDASRRHERRALLLEAMASMSGEAADASR